MTNYLLDDMAIFIAASGVQLNGANLVFGTNLFAGGFQDAGGDLGNPAADDQVAIFEDTGPGGVDTFVTAKQVLERPVLVVQVRSRNDGYQAARACAGGLWAALQGIVNQTVNGTYFVRVHPIGSPALIGRDENFRPIISCDYLVDRTPS